MRIAAKPKKSKKLWIKENTEKYIFCLKKKKNSPTRIQKQPENYENITRFT